MDTVRGTVFAHENWSVSLQSKQVVKQGTQAFEINEFDCDYL